MKGYIYQLALQAMHFALEILRAASAKGNCFTGAFYFTDGKNVVDNYALSGNGITSFSVPEPINCFRACRLECRCISFNYKQTQNLCQLNEESRYTNAIALGFAEGWQYYDLVIDYNVQGNVPVIRCENGCCVDSPCLNGGTCHETCDIIGKRFTCECGPYATGNLCETAICFTPDWLRFQNSCFKVFTEKLTWFDAQSSCALINSNLTSIHSVEENDFVRKLVPPGSPSVWIGFADLYSEDDRFEWVDGTYKSFTNWHYGEPNNMGPNASDENCTEFRSSDGGWNDLNCAYYNKTYVCGKKLNP